MQGDALRDEIVAALGGKSIGDLPIGVQLVVDRIVAVHARIQRCEVLATQTERAVEIQGYDNQVRTSEAQLMRMLKQIGLDKNQNKRKKSINEYFNNTNANQRTKEQNKKRIA